jgi:hypothetical protein
MGVRFYEAPLGFCSPLGMHWNSSGTLESEPPSWLHVGNLFRRYPFE